MKAIEVTDAAKARLLELLEQNEKPVIKLKVNNKGCSGHMYEMEYVEESDIQNFDEVIDLGEGKLAVDGASMMFVIGLHLDFQVSGFEKKFVFDNPKATDMCGCGESFNFDSN